MSRASTLRRPRTISRLLLAATFSGIVLVPAASAQTAVIRESLADAPSEALRAAYLVRPDVTERRPVVVISHGRRELAEDLKALADRVAGHGYGVLLQGPPSPASRPDDLGRMRAAVDYVANRPWADDTRVALVGFCGGGYQSLLLAAEADRPYAAVASFYGPLRFPDEWQPDEGPAFVDVFEVLGAVQATVQGHYGDRDEIIPTTDARRLGETLRARGRQAEVFVYEGAEHGFCDHTHGHYDADACSQATERLFRFLDEHFGAAVQERGKAPRKPPGDTADRSIQLAITLDDLPWVGPLPEDDSANDALVRIAAILRVHQAPATGFVICDRAQEDSQPLASWAAWGFALGNHSAAHGDLNQTPVDEWLRDVERCDSFLRRFGEATTPYFRFPLLHQGHTAEKRDRVREALRGLGLETAHVTVDTSEWILTRAHAAALRTGDAALRRQIGEEFVRHILAAVEHANDVALRKAGRPVPQVLLLHANTLVEDYLDVLLVAMRVRGVEFISLEQALADPVYERSDEYVGAKGLSWLYRMRPATPADGQWDDAEAGRIERSFAEALGDVDGEADAAIESPVSHLHLAPGVPETLHEILVDAGSSERLRSLLVMRRGELVAEAYYHGAGPETPANLKSVTKTLTSALVGVALRNEWIESLEDPVANYLPARFEGPRFASSGAQANAGITLRQLLTMSSGLATIDYGAVQQSDDWVAAVLDQPLNEGARGKIFAYDTPVLQLLTAVLEKVSGMPVEELAQRELLGPMDAELAYWRRDAQGIPLGGNDAYLRPRDLIKFGELYRRGGKLHGRQVLDPEFVEASTSVQILPPNPTVNHDTLRVRGYGFLWWLLEIGEDDVYAALGHGGQILLVSPSDELVVVMTSRWPGESSAEHYRHMTRILIDQLLPAFRPSPARPVTRDR